MRTHPYVTDGAQKFLTEFAPDKDVLEFGMGGSTVWFSGLAKTLISVEEVEPWAQEVIDYIDSIYKQCSSTTLYRIMNPNYTIIDTLKDNSVDLVLVDAKNRTRCAIQSERLIRPGGVLMLDNSDRKRYQPIFKHYEKWKLFEAKQTKPDPKTGLLYPDWKTSWWIKPI